MFKRFKKKLMVIAACIPMFTLSVPCSNATAVGDLALLAQQVAQFIQDGTLASFDIADLNDKWQQLNTIRQMISDGTEYYDDINKIINAEKKIVRSMKVTKMYVNYLMNFDDEFSWNRMGWLVKSFEQNTAYMLETAKDCVYTIAEMTGATSTMDTLDNIDKTIEELNKRVDGSINDTKTEAAKLVLDLHNKTYKKKDKEVAATSIV